MGNCKDCKYWDSYDQTCDGVEWVDLDSKIGDTEFAYYADANDDSGLSAGIKTGPMFGCIKFVAKPVKK